MYLADSESSSIRRVDLTTGGSKLLAGGDPTFADNLFQVLAGLMWYDLWHNLLLNRALYSQPNSPTACYSEHSDRNLGNPASICGFTSMIFRSLADC